MKTKFPRATALKAARAACDVLRTVTVRLIVAGSLRRRREEVGDVEVVFVAKRGDVRDGLFLRDGNLAEQAINDAVGAGVFSRRKNATGAEMWGQSNKLAVHNATGVPVDFFETTELCFPNYTVCRTGGKNTNTHIAVSAQGRGLRWNPTGMGFEVRDLSRVLDVMEVDADLAARIAESNVTLRSGALLPVGREQDVFIYAGLAWREPWERE